MSMSNGEQVERVEHHKSLNPFATEEDSDEEEESKDEFTVGDLEAEEEGKGHLPPNTGLQGSEKSIEGLLHADKNVGIPDLELSWNSHAVGCAGNTRATFPSLWPFGSSSPGLKQSFTLQNSDSDRRIDRNHFRGVNDADYADQQSSDDSDNSSDDGYGNSGVGTGFGVVHDYGGKRRLSATTEATRRTSLEDDDEDEDEEVVHVAMAEAHGEGKGEVRDSEGDDGELVEIQHSEMQGVEGDGVSEK